MLQTGGGGRGGHGPPNDNSEAVEAGGEAAHVIGEDELAGLPIKSLNWKLKALGLPLEQRKQLKARRRQILNAKYAAR